MKSTFLFLCFALISGTAFAQSGRIEVTDVTNPAPESEEAAETPPPRRSTKQVGRRYSREDETPNTGRDAAQKYMGVGSESTESRAPAASGGGTDAAHYLAIHLGAFVSDDAYHWGPASRVRDSGNFTAGVTYRVGEWVNSMDLAVRIDVSSYDLPTGSATKLSLLPIVTFPDASSKFPLYFGGGAGLGIMAKQLDGESALALEYQLLLGARFFEIFDTTGFFIEAGVKNHLHLLSDGQYNGTFIAAGAVFTF